MAKFSLRKEAVFLKRAPVALLFLMLLAGFCVALTLGVFHDATNVTTIQVLSPATSTLDYRSNSNASYKNYRVDPSGKYISTLRNSGSPRYHDDLIIMDKETGSVVYALTQSELTMNHPNLVGYLGVGTWVERPGGVYLYQVLQAGRVWGGLLYIRRDTWETHIYEAPEEVIAVAERAFAPFEPLLAYTNVTGYLIAAAGDAEEELYQDQIRDASQKILTVTDLRSGKKMVLETVQIVKRHRFNLKWLSDTELEYTMPDGEVKVFKYEVLDQ